MTAKDSGALLPSDDFGSSVERAAQLHPLWQVLPWRRAAAIEDMWTGSVCRMGSRWAGFGRLRLRLPEHRLGPVLQRAEVGAGEPGAELLEPDRRVVRRLGEGAAGDELAPSARGASTMPGDRRRGRYPCARSGHHLRDCDVKRPARRPPRRCLPPPSMACGQVRASSRAQRVRVRRLSRKESARASDIEAPAGHLDAAAEVSGDLVEAQSTAGYPPSRRTRDEEGAAEPVGFILDAGVPLAASAPVEGGGREVEQVVVGDDLPAQAAGTGIGVEEDVQAGNGRSQPPASSSTSGSRPARPSAAGDEQGAEGGCKPR
jgi:hypothetical protein